MVSFAFSNEYKKNVSYWTLIAGAWVTDLIYIVKTNKNMNCASFSVIKIVCINDQQFYVILSAFTAHRSIKSIFSMVAVQFEYILVISS